MEELELNKSMELDEQDIDNESENDDHVREPQTQYTPPKEMPGEMADFTSSEGFHLQLVSLRNSSVELGQYAYNLYQHWKENKDKTPTKKPVGYMG